MFDDHQKMAISDYKIQAKRLKGTVCPKHTGHSYSLGCKACVQIFCSMCVPENNSCVGGKYFSLFSLLIYDNHCE